MQKITEIGSPILGGQIGEVLVFLLTNTHTDRHTNNFFHLAYRSQILTELNSLYVVSGADVPFGGIDDDQLFLGVQRRYYFAAH